MKKTLSDKSHGWAKHSRNADDAKGKKHRDRRATVNRSDRLALKRQTAREVKLTSGASSDKL